MILPCMIIGYIWINQTLFLHAIYLVFISMILNLALKSTFKIPLPPFLKQDGFAFPSGHMQTAIIFYGWVMIQFSNIIIRFILFCTLVGIGISLVYFGYHNYIDIVGAVIVGVLLLFAYHKLFSLLKNILTWLMLALVSWLMVYIKERYRIPEHLWIAYFGFLGVFISDSLFVKNQAKTKDFKTKVFTTIIAFIFVFATREIFKLDIFSTLPAFVQQSQWFIIGFFIPILSLVQLSTTKKSF
jgi:hypothetical protein